MFAVAGVVCFALLGVALAHAIPNPESAPAYVNAVFLPQILLAGVFYDADDAPQLVRDIAAGPSAHAPGRRAVGRDGQGLGVGDHAVDLLVLTAVGRVGGILAFRGFSWEARRQG